MNIFTKRNAVVGFTVLKLLQRHRAQRRNRKALKIAAFVALGLVSAGILAALVAVALREREVGEVVAEASEELLEGLSVDDDLGAALPEPGFAA